MKFLPSVLLSVAALAVAACAPNHPPSDYGTDSGSLGPQNINAPEANTGGLPGRDAGLNTGKLFDEVTGQWVSAAVLTTVYFGFDKYNVEVSEREKLGSIIEKAKHVRIIVAGYTDHFGTDQYNQGLSDKRANSVKNYLVSVGVPESSIEIQAFGKRYARPNGSRAEVNEDRRAVVVNADYKP